MMPTMMSSNYANNDADTAMARKYELEIDTQYLPLAIYTLDVDYPDAGVQVTNQEGKEQWQSINCRRESGRRLFRSLIPWSKYLNAFSDSRANTHVICAT